MSEAPSWARPAMHGKSFVWNPVLHRYAMPARTDFGSPVPIKDTDIPLSQSPTPGYLSGEIDVPAYLKDPNYLKHLRLGRIFQDERAAGSAANNRFRYGFRFLYNPTSVDTTVNRNNTMIADPQSTVAAVVSGINQNFQVITFSLLLNRVHDLASRNPLGNQYPIPISAEDVAGIKKFGTHWDLEYLYKVCNGTFNLQDRGATSDIGVLLPSNARLMLGPGKDYFGFVEGVTYKDVLFTQDMVPTLSIVQIMFRRHVDMVSSFPQSFEDSLGNDRATNGNTDRPVARAMFPTPQDTSTKPEPQSTLSATGNGEGGIGETITQEMITNVLESFPDIFAHLGPVGDVIMESLKAEVDYPKLSGGGVSGVNAGLTTTQADGSLLGGQVERLIIEAGVPAADAAIMTKIAYIESRWMPTAFNDSAVTKDLSYGLWQVNMRGALGPERRTALKLASNEQLFDPATNARAAKWIYDQVGGRMSSTAAWNASYYKALNDRSITWSPWTGSQSQATPGQVVGNNSDAPVPGYNKVTTGWWYRDGREHGGADYGTYGIDGKPVHSTRAGTIHAIRRLGDVSYGNYIVIRSPSGEFGVGDIYHYYCHLRDFAPGLTVGMSIQAGTHIGYVGDVGNSSGPHLHYEERVDNVKRRTPKWGTRYPGSVS